MDEAIKDVRYPIGRYQSQAYNDSLRKKWLSDLEALPGDIELAIQNLDEYQLATPYRDSGWTVIQLVHHVADSHMNAYIRFKLALTEDSPVIKTYDEKAWANLNDVATVPINVSLTLLHALHRRWVAALDQLDEDVFLNRHIFHPEQQKLMSVWNLLGLYVWHGAHHVAHITALKAQKGW